MMTKKITSQLDLSEIESVPYRKTLTFVNTFIIHTTHFLNRFAALCEEKLMEVSNELERLGTHKQLQKQKHFHNHLIRQFPFDH
jgi:WASH complex subunit CCDC53